MKRTKTSKPVDVLINGKSIAECSYAELKSASKQMRHGFNDLTYKEVRKFLPQMKVSFRHGRSDYEGVIEKVNRKTVSVRIYKKDGDTVKMYGRVSPNLLTVIK